MGSPSPERPTKPSGGGGLAAFASLLDPNSKPEAGTISRAPVVYEKPGEKDASKTQVNASALRFQPTKRPQQQTQIKKPKPSTAAASAKPSAAPADSSPDPSAAPLPSNNAAPRPVSTLADWTADADDDAYYVDEKRARGGRKKRKKQHEAAPVILNWDDVYDPSQPNKYADYKQSEEKYREIREWKDKLHAHEILRDRQRGRSGTARELSEEEDRAESVRNRGFAPPASYDFAPPAVYDDDDDDGDEKMGGYSSPRKPQASQSPRPAVRYEPVDVPDDTTGDDAYARRMAMSNAGPPPQPQAASTTPSQEAPELAQASDQPVQQPPPPPSSTTASASTSTITRGPVLYTKPLSSPPAAATPSDSQSQSQSQPQPQNQTSPPPPPPTNEPRSLRPGQKDFATRLLSKYGYTPGSGLGATGTGIATPLSVQLDKRKKKSDAAGGGFAGPAGTGKIVGGRRSKAAEEEERERERMEKERGVMGEVVCVRGLLRGVGREGLDAERESGRVVQGVGEECAERFGRVERVVVGWDAVGEGQGDGEGEGAVDQGPPVFVKFASALSALRAVDVLEGQKFGAGGNVVRVRFYSVEAFENGVYE